MKHLILFLAGASALTVLAEITETIENRVVTLSGASGSTLWTKSYSADDVDRVVIDSGANLRWAPLTPSTYTGGTISKASLVYLGANGALGTGDFDMQSGALSVVAGTDITIPNKVIFNQNNTYGYACAMDGDGSITLQSVGSPASGSTHHIRLGRASATSAGTATLSLTQDNSEALDQIFLAGKADVTLKGGTVKARSDAKAPFFKKVWDNSSPTVTVATDGVTFDVPSDTSVTLGETLTVEQKTREVVVETFYPENWSFEDSYVHGATPAGWTIINETESGSGAFENGDYYDGKGLYPTTNGTHYVMIRRGGKLQQTIAVPTAGKWRVVLERGCRDGFYSLQMNSWVMIGDTKVMDMPRLDSAAEGFTQYVSDALELAAGQDYLLSIELEAISAGNRSFNFDAIRLVRVVDVPIPVPFGKSGLGTLNAGVTVMSNATITVSAGTLKSAPESLAGSTVAVADGATYALDGATLADVTSVTVAAGGTLQLSGTMDNLLVNGSFEAGYTAGYTANAVEGWTGSGSWYGISKTDSGTLAVGLTASGCGDQALFLRDVSAVEQTITVPTAGDYLVSFLEAPRQYQSPHQLPITVSIDGEAVFTVAPRATKATSYVRHTGRIALTAGTHVFKLATGPSAVGGSGHDLLLDDIALRPAAKTVIGGTLALASGSTLVLNNAQPIRWTTVTVDGTPVNGSKNILTAHGVTVQGEGKLWAGEPHGLNVIFR